MKTKSYLFAAASATLMLASCTQNEVVEMPATRAIGFGTYVGNTSRAVSETTDIFLQNNTATGGNGFYVFGVYKDGANEVTVFDGKSNQSHVSYDGVAWGYEPINYWLFDKTYKFAAYGPAAALNKGEASFNYTNNTLTISNFSSEGTLDLVVAEADKNGYTVNTPAEGADATVRTVPFKFFHALSKVRFTFVNGWRNHVTLTVSDVKISGVKHTGTLTTSGSLADAAVGNGISWALGTDKKEYTWADTFESKIFNQNSNFDYTKNETTGDITATPNARYEYFLMPQDIATDAIKLTLTCKVTNSAGQGPDLGGGSNSKAVTIIIPNDQVSKWEAGKAYNYTLTLDGKFFGLLPIQFDNITVNDWTNYQDDILNKDDIK